MHGIVTNRDSGAGDTPTKSERRSFSRASFVSGEQRQRRCNTRFSAGYSPALDGISVISPKKLNTRQILSIDLVVCAQINWRPTVMADQDTRLPESANPDVDNLYREQNFTDMKAATVRQLTPVKSDGTPDESRPLQFIGDTTLMTQLGPIPVQFQISAESLDQAFEKFPEGVQAAIVQLNERAQQLAREEASRIVVPGKNPGGGFPGGVPGGGGKIVID